MQICGTCCELYGYFTTAGQPCYQPCGCKEKGETAVGFGGSDFPCAWELCYCCGQTVIGSGTRWSVFFCEPCKAQVVALNKQHGFAVIPLGRHSLMNQVVLNVRAPDQADEMRKFTENAAGLFERINRLRVWRKRIITRILQELGFPRGSDAELENYVLRVGSLRPQRASVEELAACLSNPSDASSSSAPKPTL